MRLSLARSRWIDPLAAMQLFVRPSFALSFLKFGRRRRRLGLRSCTRNRSTPIEEEEEDALSYGRRNVAHLR